MGCARVGVRAGGRSGGAVCVVALGLLARRAGVAVVTGVREGGGDGGLGGGREILGGQEASEGLGALIVRGGEGRGDCGAPLFGEAGGGVFGFLDVTLGGLEGGGGQGLLALDESVSFFDAA